MEIHRHLIAGEDVPGEGHPNINPSDTDDVIGWYAQAVPDDVDAAVAAARQAQPSWERRSPAQRAAILEEISVRVTRATPELARMLAREEGKTLAEASGEVGRAAATFRYYAGQLMNPIGAVLHGLSADTRVHTVRRAVGVIGVITPWNFPIAIPAWKVAPALAYGNAVILKPADLVPGTAWMLSQIIRDAGVPAGVFNLVMGRGSVVGQRLVDSPGVDAISFTGSTAVGLRLAQQAAGRGLAKLQLEMGGKNGLVVLDDADVDAAVAAAVDGAFGSTGQRCTASSRLVVQQGIHDAFLDRLSRAMDEIVVGPALEAGTTMGPVVSEQQLEQNLAYVQAGQDGGARLVRGGGRTHATTPGYFMEPTLFAGTTSEMRINQEEIFGPIASIISVDGLDEALAVTNDTPYGLSAGIFTGSLDHAARFQREVRAGIIAINRSPALSEYHAPFGGVKNSSLGPREQGQAAAEFYTTTATVYTGGGGW